jgi:hypothetical protein
MTPVKPGEYGRSAGAFVSAGAFTSAGAAGTAAGASGVADVAFSVLLVVIVALLGAW